MTENKAHASTPICQSCLQPVKIEEKLFNVNEIEKKFIQDALKSKMNDEDDSEDQKLLKDILPALSSLSINDAEDNFDEGESSLSNRFLISSYLFDLLSEKTEFEHPLCKNCSDTILTTIEQQVMFKNDELKCINDYHKYLLKKTQIKSNELSRAELEKDQDEDQWSDDFDDSYSTENEFISKEDSCELSDSISDLTAECRMLERQVVEEENELKRKEAELENLTMKYNDTKLVLQESESEIYTLELKLKSLIQHYERLKHSNILNMTFPISTDDHIGTISGLHLGRLPNKPIEWSEINAAWGQCALLMNCLAKKLEHTFQHYIVIYHADQSRIHVNETDRDLMLCNNSTGIRIFSSSNFDSAMMAFLECLSELQSKISSFMKLPYQIVDKHLLRHEDNSYYSIKYTRKNEENWTKALHRMLINLKWLIVFCSISKSKGPRVS